MVWVVKKLSMLEITIIFGENIILLDHHRILYVYHDVASLVTTMGCLVMALCDVYRVSGVR